MLNIPSYEIITDEYCTVIFINNIFIQTKQFMYTHEILLSVPRASYH